MLGGLAGAFIMPAVTAFIVDLTTDKNRARSLGYMTAAINFGFIIGPVSAGYSLKSVHGAIFRRSCPRPDRWNLIYIYATEPKKVTEVAADKPK